MLPKAEWSDSETELLAVSWMQWLYSFFYDYLKTFLFFRFLNYG
jgi:hypothetical protein